MRWQQLGVIAASGGLVAAAVVYALAGTPPTLTRWEAPIRAAAEEAGVDEHLLRALVAAESSGRPRARSRAGALGLLQLMPATAKEEAVRRGLGVIASEDLFDPELNLRLGAFYLRRMLDRFEGDAALAVAAYNAGPGRVKQWLAKTKDMKLTSRERIERVGYEETKRHVAKVTQWAEAYRTK